MARTAGRRFMGCAPSISSWIRMVWPPSCTWWSRPAPRRRCWPSSPAPRCSAPSASVCRPNRARRSASPPTRRWCTYSMPAPACGLPTEAPGRFTRHTPWRNMQPFGPLTSRSQGSWPQTTGNGGNHRMTITRRDSLALGAAALGAASIPMIGARAAVDDVPTADVKAPEFPIEKGASLHVLRPAKFIDPDEVFWKSNTKKFIETTGVDVKVDFVSWEDLRPQLAVIANTGAGADIVISFGSDPHIYASKLVDLTDLADYLGAKYGGWYDLALLYGQKWKTKDWIGIPIGGGTGPVVYRKSWVNEVGYDKIPNDHEGFLTLCQKLQKAGHPFGMSLGHALGDANGYSEWLLWSHNAYVVDENGKIALDSKATITALKYASELQKTQVSGNLSWNDSGNNKAYAAGDIGLTFNGVSIYYFLNNSPVPKLQQ